MDTSLIAPLTGRALAITGASTGIGAATARLARAHGMKLVLGARSVDKLESLAAELGGDEHAIAVELDVREWDSQQAFAASAQRAFGGVDAVFANAGFGAERGFEKSTPELWKDMVLTNVYGCALTIRAMLPALRESRGHALLTSSVAGRRVLPGSLYSCTKFAVSAMGEALRQEADGTGIRVTLIEPGMTDTPFFEDGTPDWALTAEDIARSVVYAIGQPPHVDVNEILIRPTGQPV